MANGNRYVVFEMSTDYGENRWAIEDLALQRDNLVRHWRQRGQGRVTVAGVKPPKKGMIWRGSEDEATRLCEQMNKASSLGSLSVASDPPIRANSVAYAKSRATMKKRGANSSGFSVAMKEQAALFKLCPQCNRMHKGETCP